MLTEAEKILKIIENLSKFTRKDLTQAAIAANFMSEEAESAGEEEIRAILLLKLFLKTV